MGKTVLRNQLGVTIVELLVVLVVLGIVMSISVVAYGTYVENTSLGVLEHNQQLVERNIEVYLLPENIRHNSASELRDKFIDLNTRFVNPYTSSDLIVSVDQTFSVSSASIVIVENRDVTMQQALNTPDDFLWPLTSSLAQQNKFRGTIVIKICSNGFLVYTFNNNLEVINSKMIAY